MRQTASMESGHERRVLTHWQNSQGMWGRLTTCGRLPIGLGGARKGPVCARRRVVNPPQVANLPHMRH